MQGTWFNRRKRLIIEVLFLLLIATLVVIDQVSKYYFSNNFTYGQKQSVIDNFFYFTYTLNTGAAWSFLADVSWGQTFFKALTVVALVGFSFFYYSAVKKGYKWLRVALILVISGTVGNFIDRVTINAVIDFIGFTFGSYNFPIFNLADSFLVVGVIMIIFHFLFVDPNAVFKKKNGNENISNN